MKRGKLGGLLEEAGLGHSISDGSAYTAASDQSVNTRVSGKSSQLSFHNFFISSHRWSRELLEKSAEFHLCQNIHLFFCGLSKISLKSLKEKGSLPLL